MTNLFFFFCLEKLRKKIFLSYGKSNSDFLEWTTKLDFVQLYSHGVPYFMTIIFTNVTDLIIN